MPRHAQQSSAAAISIRTAHPGQLETVVALLSEANLPTEGVAEGFGDQFAVATERDQVIGAIGVERHGDYGLMRSAVVAPAHRGRRIGEALVTDRIEASQQAGIRTLYLLTTTAAGWFPRFGFSPVPRDQVPEAIRQSAEFSSICPSTATVMELRLGESGGR